MIRSRSIREGLLLYGVPLVAGSLLRVVGLIRYLDGSPFAKALFSDAHAYLRWAERIASEGGIAEPFYQAPLYPHLLSLPIRFLGSDPVPIYVLQTLLGLGSIFLVASIGNTFLERRFAAGAATVFAILPYTVYYELKVLPETAGLFLCLLALRLILRAGEGGRAWILSAGIAAGVAALGRANFLLFGVMVLPWFFVRRGGRSVLFALGIAAVVLPVTIHNVRSGGGPVLIASNGGEVFYHGNNGNALGSMGVTPELNADIETLPRQTIAAASRAAGRPLNAAAASGYWARRGLSWIGDHPGDWLRLELRKARRLVSARHVPIGEFFDFEAERFPAVPHWLLYLHYPILFLAVSALLRRESRALLPVPVLLFGVVPVVTVLVFFACTRYALPLQPVLVLLAGASAAAGFRGRSPVLLFVLAIPVALLAITDRGVLRPRATPYARLASIRSGEGRSGEAVALYEEALRIAPSGLVHYQNLALEKERNGDFAGAAAVLDRAARLGLSDGQTLGYHGAILVRLGRWKEAEGVLRKGTRVDPSRARIWYELGKALQGAGRHEEAEEAYGEAVRLAPNDAEIKRALRR